MRPRAIVAALALAACGGWLSQPGQPPASAPGELRALRFFVDERVAVVAEGTAGSGLDLALRRALEAEMARAGLTVAADAAKADVVAHLDARVEELASVVSRGRASLRLDAGGKTIDTVETGQQTVDAVDFAAVTARKLTSALVAAPKLLSLARERAPAGPPSAPAQPPPPDSVATARQHTRQATSLYNLDRLGEALTEYEAAYLAVPDPALLYNIAQCHRRLGHRDEAIAFYRKYLRNAPAAPNRAEVEKRIQELTR